MAALKQQQQQHTESQGTELENMMKRLDELELEEELQHELDMYVLISNLFNLTSNLFIFSFLNVKVRCGRRRNFPFLFSGRGK